MNKFIDIEKRDEHSMSKFVNELISLDIYEKLDKQLNSDPNNNFEVLSQILKYAREKHLPKKKVKYQKKLHKKSKWISSGILKSINTKDRLYKVLIQTDSSNTVLYERLLDEFKQYRAELRRCIRKAKRDYYTSIFNQHKHDVRKMWGLLNETLNRNIRKQTTQEFSHNNGTTSDPEVIANTFNEYFINIGESLADQIKCSYNLTCFLCSYNLTCFFYMDHESEINIYTYIYTYIHTNT